MQTTTVARAFFLLSCLTIACSNSDSSAPAPAAAAAASTEQSGGSSSSRDVAVAGQLAIDNLPVAVKGTDGIKLGNRDVEVVDASGSVLAKAVSAVDGTFSVIVPGALAVSTPAGALKLADGSLSLRSVIANTADASVVGVNQALDLAAAKGGALKVGTTQLQKITAIRGKATIDGARDHSGIAIYIPGTSYAARTDSAGNFLMIFMPAGTYDLNFEKDGYQSVSVSGTAVADGETTKLSDQVLRLAGGAGFFSVKQVGVEGLSKSRTVEFLLSPGGADRFKGGQPSEVETMPYGSIPARFSYTFPTDGEFQLKLVFATADGFESSITKSLTVDSVAPAVTDLKLVDRTSLNDAYTNETAVVAYHPSCTDITTVAILPATTTEPKDTDFIFPCFSNVSSSENAFQISQSSGAYAYKIWARDAVGNVSATPASGTITVLTGAPEAPAITLRDQTSSSSVASNARTVDVALATCAGIKNVLISESQATQPSPASIVTPCATTATHTFATDVEGLKKVFVWSIDHAGNVSTISSSATITFDVTAPTAPTLSIADPTPANAGYSNSLTLNAGISSCADAAQVLVSESQTSQPTESTSGWLACVGSGLTVTVGGEGTRTVYLWTKDGAGNVSNAADTKSIVVDTTPPTSPTFTIADATNGSTAYTNGLSVSIGISSCAGIDKVYVSESSTAPAAAAVTTACTTSGISLNLANLTEETKTVYLWGKDAAGNVASAAATDTITMDVSAPNLPGTFAIKDSTSASTSFSNNIAADFALDACPAGAQILVRKDQTTAPTESDSAWMSCATTGTISNLLTTSPTAQTVYLWVKDDAGNVKTNASLSHTITYDATAPTAPAFTMSDVVGGSSAGYTNALTVNVTVADCTDIDKILLSESSSTPSEASVSTACATAANNYQFPLTGGVGTKILYLWVKDAAGNISQSSSTIEYDTGTPSVTGTVTISDIGTTTVKLMWTTSEPTRTRVEYGTSSGTPYSYTYDLNETSGSASTSHTATITANLAQGTQYYFRIAAPDFAEHTGYSSEMSFTTMGLTKIFHTEDYSQLGGFLPSGIPSVTSKQLITCDVRGDSKEEVVVAAPNSSSNGRTSNGNVYVILGASGISGTSKNVPTDSVLTIQGDSNAAGLGNYIACLDFNGDGKKDLLVVETSVDAYIIFGSTSTTPATIDTNSTYSVKIAGIAAASSAVGNFNGDTNSSNPLDDVTMCASDDCNVYYGRTTAAPYTITASTGWSYKVDSSVTLGMGLDMGDVDGDGFADLVMGAWNANGENGLVNYTGAAYIRRGGNSASYNSGTTLSLSATSGYDYAVYGTESDGRLAIPFVTDIDGDGYADILLRRYYGASDVYITFGRPAGPVAGLDWSDDPKVQVGSLRLSNISMGASGGEWRVSGNIAAKDINNDGIPDLVVGDPRSGSDTGKVCLFMGRSQADWATIGPSISLTSADLCMSGPDPLNFVGQSVAIGNIDGTSGRRQILFGAPGGSGNNDTLAAAGEVGVVFFEVPTISHGRIDFDLVPHF